MKILIIAGEASGDLHGAGVVSELKRRHPDAEIFGIGGDKMQNAGMKLIYHINEVSVMGFWEVVKHLPVIRSVEKTLLMIARTKKPDVILLIDYPGFNLRFAEKVRSVGSKIVYYISPQVWAWNSGRVKKMKALLDKMLVVFSFEEEIYRNEGIPVEFVGHPLLEVLKESHSKKDFCKRYGLDESKPIIGLFPGSRRQEIERIFPPMLGAARILHAADEAQTVVGVASVLDMEYMKSFLRDDFPVQLLQHATYDAMACVDVALVTSGTATLETAYFKTPMVVVYKTSWLTYLIGRMLVKVKNIGLVNIVAGKQIVPELIQDKVKPLKLAVEAAAMLEDKVRRERIIQELSLIRTKLGTAGASGRVADAISTLAGNA
ncbi:MAG: lipid-A-disaccharide synthase [Ignavibacteriae bacterium]|nr:lipid-A-disaccharide synthase [Ignavibacteriota bacterium]